MKETILNGNFGLGEIKKITKRMCGLTPYYIIEFTDDKRKLHVTNYHSFVTVTSESKVVCDLQSGDEIWIDISAFSKDGTLK